MRRIKLTRGKYAIVDNDDYTLVSNWKWYAAQQPKTFYAARSARVNGKKVTIWMHRVINETPKNKFTDHINGRGLDNRRQNLRDASHRENMLNNTRHKIGSSKYRGVSWHIGSKAWIAQITVDSKNNWIGSFRTEKAARDAYIFVRAKLLPGKLVKI